MKATFADRLKLLRGQVDSDRALSRLIGASPTAVGNWLDGAEPFLSSIRKIAKRTGLSEAWLTGGPEDDDGQVQRWRTYVYNAPTPRERLLRAVERADMNPRELATAIGYDDAGYVESVLNGTAAASEKMIEAVCRLFPWLDKADLLSGSDTARVFREDGTEGTFGSKPPIIAGLPADTFYVPLLSWGQAGALEAGWGDGDAGYDHTGVLAMGIKDRRSFAVEIKGDSMSPEIKEGDRVIVCPNERVRVGDTVLVRTLNGDVMCKVYQPKDATSVAFISVNNARHPSIEISRSEIAWIYPVRQVVRNY